MKDNIKVFEYLLPKIQHKTGELNDKMITWLPIIICGKYEEILGLTESGLWVMESENGLISIQDSKYVFLIPILENDYSDVIKSLREFNLQLDSISLVSIFPFVEIVKSGLEQKSDYWTELALNWFDQFNANQKRKLLDTLDSIVSSKRLSQKIRHRIRKTKKAAKF